MSTQSGFQFGARNARVFAIDGADGVAANTTPVKDDSTAQYEAMFNDNMAKQMKTYGVTNKLNTEKNTMQSIMDVGMKASKAVST